MDVSRPVFELLIQKIARSPHPTLVDALAQRNSTEFLDEIYPTKTRRMGYCTVNIA